MVRTGDVSSSCNCGLRKYVLGLDVIGMSLHGGGSRCRGSGSTGVLAAVLI